MVSQDRLKELFSYNPENGKFTRIKTLSSRAIAGDSAGSIHPHGYLQIMIDGSSYKAHRLAWLYESGEHPPLQIDHVNHDRSDNRMSNLRAVDHINNMKNQKLSSNNASGVNGVAFNKKTKKWVSRIKVDRKDIYLGSFDSIFDAEKSRVDANNKHGFHLNHGAKS